ncbi:LOW QUALITY PROTEIN: Sec8_exocyst domain-containing protein [Cephalotus follicularis]|uniref:Exocyst complex component Sec8 n=1 Tax=Cephalotus follicularis TaxID=3775 RepID=A0A1Q3BHR6_CEPFO|nr:LOW QUALITY PROTEIN: Sec8_exocyst domain-containing protein [Cephalotus follicularis]
MGLFDGLPVPPEKAYLRDEVSRIDESWAAARFDSLPHVVHILTSKDREGEAQVLKDQSDVVEEVVDEVVHAYHSGFNKAIQNYSQILRLFSESTESIAVLKVDLADAKKRLGTRSKQLHQLWYRSVTLRHIISLLDQIEGMAKVPARIEKLIAEKQFYAAVQLHVQSSLMLEREGLQTVGALQDVRSELTKLRGVLFYKLLEDLHLNSDSEASQVTGGYTPDSSSTEYVGQGMMTLILTRAEYDEMVRSQHASGPSGSLATLAQHGQSESTCLLSSTSQPWVIDSGCTNHMTGDKNILSDTTPSPFATVTLADGSKSKVASTGSAILSPLSLSSVYHVPSFLYSLLSISRLTCDLDCIVWFSATFCVFQDQKTERRVGGGRESGGLYFLDHDIVAAVAVVHKTDDAYKLHCRLGHPSADVLRQFTSLSLSSLQFNCDTCQLEYRAMANVSGELQLIRMLLAEIGLPMQRSSILHCDNQSSMHIAGNPVFHERTKYIEVDCHFVREKVKCGDIQLVYTQSEEQLADIFTKPLLSARISYICKKGGSEDGHTFAFRFTDATISIPNQGADLIRQGWSRRGPNVLQEGYGSAAVLPEQGMYLAASVYRPVLQFADKVFSMLPTKYSQLGNDGLLAFVENFVKDHFLPTMFVDYRKGVQQAISSNVFTGPAAFRPRAHTAATYTPSIEKGRPVLQGLLAIDFLAKEVSLLFPHFQGNFKIFFLQYNVASLVVGWAQAMPKFAADLVKYVQTFLERTYERCRTSYMEAWMFIFYPHLLLLLFMSFAVLEKQSYMLIGRHDIEKLMRLDPASSCLPNPLGMSNMRNNASDAEAVEIEAELSELLLNLRPIKQENLIRDDSKLILLASLSDSLEYVADSIESAPPKNLASFAEEYRKLAIDCSKVLRVEMQLETIFHMQEMTSREYLEDQDAEEPDDFIISLTAQITRRDEEIAPFVAGVRRNYIFGGICGIAANASIKALADMKSINLFGVQLICRNSIALEQALAAIPSIDSESVQQRLDRVRTYYELLNMPFEANQGSLFYSCLQALLAFIAEHEYLFTATEYMNLLKVQVRGREIPPDAQDRVSEILSH